MQPTDQPPPVEVTPAPVPLPRPIDVGLRRLTLSANHGVLWFSIGAVGFLLGGRSRRAALRGVASLSMASFVSNSLVKPIVGRRRPDPERTRTARRIGYLPWTSSFPSGHSASAAAFAAGAAMELPLSATVLGPLAGAVAYSRVHVGVHYPSDAVVGMGIGAALALIGKKLWPVKPFGAATSAPGSAPSLPGGEGLTIVVNEASGSSDGATESLSKLLPRARVVAWDPAQQELSELIGPDPRALGVAGGDGTVAAVAHLAHAKNLPLAVFPFGTLNHFAGSMGVTDEKQIAEAVEAGTAKQVDIATVNGSSFLNTSSIGGYPQLVLRRDRLSPRMGKWPAAAYALFLTLRHQVPMDLEINGTAVPTWIVFVGNGVYRPRGLAPAWREDLSSGVLDLQYLRADRVLARTKAVVLSLLGLIERSDVLVALDVPEVTIRSKSGPLPSAHDGEVDEPTEEFVFATADRRLTVYR
jgi:diacylglycerol kinase family enzyme/membrane-associated phospholipid phosphatase